MSVRRSLLLSIRPCYANPIFERVKTVELRKRVGADVRDRSVFVYVTRPIGALVGGFRVGLVWSGSPSEVWDRVSHMANVSKQEYETYYADQEVAYALTIEGVWQYRSPIGLDVLRRNIPQFVVPQSWRYVREEEFQAFGIRKE